MSAYQTHKSTPAGKAQTLARKAARRDKHAHPFRPTARNAR